MLLLYDNDDNDTSDGCTTEIVQYLTWGVNTQFTRRELWGLDLAWW